MKTLQLELEIEETVLSSYLKILAIWRLCSIAILERELELDELGLGAFGGSENRRKRSKAIL